MMEWEMYGSWNCMVFVWGKLKGNKREVRQKEGRHLQSIPPLLEFGQTVWLIDFVASDIVKYVNPVNVLLYQCLICG